MSDPYEKFGKIVAWPFGVILGFLVCFGAVTIFLNIFLPLWLAAIPGVVAGAIGAWGAATA